MKTIRWTGEERVIPNEGVTSPGQELTLDDKTARSFIEQGLAEAVKPRPRVTHNSVDQET